MVHHCNPSPNPAQKIG
ncbi:hypothetical protein MTR67_023912 [Solanum verrucosum]|uniref:Uncharacterized protein n=1 Tax=Solanum verrucosum TaxID=315347 RepID=A0AAF0QXT7_SOLVR|nr:hypothetical protein MTR67_023912 [Solanum verrucosum]